MTKLLPAAVLAPAIVVGAAFTLGACGSMTTYGTGTTAAKQTVDDLTGILSFGSKDKNGEIDYEPRPPIVEPPVATLPPPGSTATNVATAANWPVDPDEERKRVEALVKESHETGQSLKFTPPAAPRVETDPKAPLAKSDDDNDLMARRLTEAKMRGQDYDEAKKIFADAKQAKIGSFDENGNPVRQYLVEPPAPYREPDPESPIEITEKPKKKNGLKLPDLWPF
jgi:hypothetical protein